jgi:hypothetical protein
VRAGRIDSPDRSGWVVRLSGVYVESSHELDSRCWLLMLRVLGTVRVPGVYLLWEATGNGQAYGSVQLGGDDTSVDLTVFFEDPRRRLRLPLVQLDAGGSRGLIFTVWLGRDTTGPPGRPNPWLSVTRWRRSDGGTSALLRRRLKLD